MTNETYTFGLLLLYPALVLGSVVSALFFGGTTRLIMRFLPAAIVWVVSRESFFGSDLLAQPLPDVGGFWKPILYVGLPVGLSIFVSNRLEATIDQRKSTAQLAKQMGTKS